MSRPALLLATVLMLGTVPATAQAAPKNEQASACRNEAERFAATFATPERAGSGPRADTAPGARAGTTLSDEDRRQLRRRVDEARAAADRGDAEGCLRTLREARMAVRQAGFGAGSGSAAPSQGTSGSRAGGSGSGQ